MDAEDYNTDGLGNVSEVVTHVKQVRKDGMGVISMKLVGEGAFTNREDRQAAMRYAFQKSRASIASRSATRTHAEIDEAIENVNLALAYIPRIPLKNASFRIPGPVFWVDI